MDETLRLGDLCEKIGSGATPRGGKENYSDNGPVALIRSQNIYNERFSHGGLARISYEQAAHLQNVEVKDGDVLLNITGDSVARACQVDNAVLPARVNQHVAIIRPTPGRLNARFLRYFLATPSMHAIMLGLAAAGATRNALTKSMIEGFRVPAWPVERQRAVASILGALDDKIELNRRMNETLEAMARAIFKDWFVDFGPTRAKMEGRAPYLAPDIWALFPERLDDEGKPEGWEFAPVRDVVDFNPSERLEQGLIAPYLDMAALPTSGSWPDAPIGRAFSSGSKFRNGDALLARITPCLENGKAAFIQSLPDRVVAWGSTEFIVMRAKPPMPSEYAYLIARDPAFKDRAVQSMTGTSGRQRVQVNALAEYVAAKPDLEVAQAFAAFVVPYFTLIAANAKHCETLAAMRDLLLPKLMSGEIRVREAEKAIEAVA